MSSKVDLFNNTNIQKIQQYLDNNPDLDITKMHDEKGNTLIHASVLNNKKAILHIYIEKIKETLDKRYWENSSVYKRPVQQ